MGASNAPVQPAARAGGIRFAAAVRRHAPGLLVALLLAAALVSPRWWLLWTDPSEGVRTQVNPGGIYGVGQDETFYIPGIRQAYEGSIPIRDPYLADHGSEPPEATALWQEVTGLFAHMTGGDIFYALALVTSLAALATFVLYYAIAFQITGRSWVAVAAMLVTVIYVQVFYQAQGYLPLRHWAVLKPILMVRSSGDFHVWYRFLAPAMPLPVFFAAVLALLRAATTYSRASVGVAAVTLGLLVYTYLFFWTSIAVALGLWACWLAYERDFLMLRRLAVIGGVAAVLAIPELTLVALNAASLSFDAKSRSGLGHPGIDSGTFVTITQRLLVGVPFAWYALKGPSWSRGLIALYVAPLLLGMTTGLVPQPDHFMYQAWPPFSLPLFIAGATEFARRLRPTYARVGAASLAVVAAAGLVYMGAFQARAMDRLGRSYALSPDEDAAMRWIAEHAGNGEVIVSTSRTTNILVVSLTGARVYVPYGSSAVGSKAETDEIIDRYLRASVAFGYTAESTFYRLDPANGIPRPEKDVPRDEIPEYVERSMVDYLLNEFVASPEKVISRLPAWRSQFDALQSERGVLGRYRAGYLYCGPRERLWAGDAPAPGTFVRTAFQQGRVRLYRLSDASDPDAQPFVGCNLTHDQAEP
jgi:hypothetical protein